MKLFPLLALLASPVWAQINAEFQIDKIEPGFQESPSFTGPRYDKRGSKAKQWLEVEVAFSWQPRAKIPKYTDELTFNYYVLLNNKSTEFPQGTLLVGSATLTSIPQEKGMRTVIYVAPRTLERFFDGKVPGTISAAVVDAGVTISKQGQLVAIATWKGQVRGSQGWWDQYQQTPGFLLNKLETPFAPLNWDYYEAVKSKSPGL